MVTLYPTVIQLLSNKPTPIPQGKLKFLWKHLSYRLIFIGFRLWISSEPGLSMRLRYSAVFFEYAYALFIRPPLAQQFSFPLYPTAAIYLCIKTFLSVFSFTSYQVFGSGYLPSWV
ncbi:hypothetical protein K435DRAFT_851901 [Dendrothele bispora CBS 962.96]|uniref:Uncharacterized protein n=1 Tax=Dendrothele bispora (strain CBS 962.96) TaxID=1314807 RepID=A0A4S8MME9_DENBC|nr:hypothetical protein K435DRAFT_851901 [Dendrothele bispora CBS 962.96]